MFHLNFKSINCFLQCLMRVLFVLSGMFVMIAYVGEEGGVRGEGGGVLVLFSSVHVDDNRVFCFVKTRKAVMSSEI